MYKINTIFFSLLTFCTGSIDQKINLDKLIEICLTMLKYFVKGTLY